MSGFTAYSEAHRADEVITMLNTYWGATVPMRAARLARFRIGVNTGPAAVGHVGAARMRSFTAIGDPANLSAPLQAQARPGTS